MNRNISNRDDIIDSRDVIARIEELEDQFAASELDLREQQAPEGTDPDDIEPDCTCGTCGAQWNDSLSSSVTPTPSGRCPFEDEHEERAELKALQSLAEEAEGYASDWKHGETLIRDSYFEDYARQLAEDIGAIPNDAQWPCTCIDWKQAAEELQQDYTSVDFDGVTYWVR